MLTLITSLNADLYQRYGQRMLDSFARMSKDVRLIVVFEGDIPPALAGPSDLIRVVKLESEDFDRFHLFFGNLYEAHGLKVEQRREPNGKIRLQLVSDFRFHLVRFSFKIFSIDIGRKLVPEGEKFAWIDADVNCLTPVSAADLAPFLPEGEQIMSYLGRTRHPPDNPYSECGFLGFNPASAQLDAFLNRMKSLYTTGEAFRFREWHDSWLWDEVRKEFEAKGFQFKNISGDAMHLEHPFVNCGLGKFFDHLKGTKRKERGRSFEQDYSENN